MANVIKIEKTPLKVMSSVLALKGRKIYVDFPDKVDSIFIPFIELDTSVKLWNDKVYCTTEKDTDEEVEFKY